MWNEYRSRTILAVLFAMGLAASAQTFPPIRHIEVYGLRTVPDSSVLAALPIHSGDTVPNEEALRDAERKLMAVPLIRAARVSLACCDDGASTLYVGVQDTDVPPLQFRAAPTQHLRVPSDIREAAEAYDRAVEVSVLSARRDRDLALAADRRRLVTLTTTHHALLREVLLRSESKDDRALAARVLALLPSLPVSELLPAVRDPAPEVRNDTMRGLAVIASSAEAPVREIASASFGPLLRSLEWTDRNKAAAVLFSITTVHRDASTLAALRCDAVLPLAEMAEWHSPAHALAPFYLLGRIAGLEESVIAELWRDRNLAAVLQAIDSSPADCGGRFSLALRRSASWNVRQ
jgi:hypothetical protein